MINRARIWIIVLVILFIAPFKASAMDKVEVTGQEIPVWPEGQIPNLVPNAPPEEFDGRSFYKISHPSLYAFPLPPEKRNGVALLYCPGGGFQHVGYIGGIGVQEYLAPQGVTVFVLKYRVAPPSKQAAKDALADATRAMQIIRSRAAEWGIDPNKIGMAGHSAGAHLTLDVATHPVAADPASPDPVLHVSSAPNFIALCSTWAVNNLRDFPLNKETMPPVIMFHAQDDKTAPFPDAEKLSEAIHTAGIPLETHWIDKGDHMSFAFLDKGRPGADWLDTTITWLKQKGIWPSS